MQSDCAAFAANSAAAYPKKSPKKLRPQRAGTAFWLRNHNGDVWLRRRPPRGLLAGMTEVPTTPWWPIDSQEAATDPQTFAPAACRWQPLPQQVRHQFTHFGLTLSIWTGRLEEVQEPAGEGFWVALKDVSERPLPTLMKKVIAAASETVT